MRRFFTVAVVGLATLVLVPSAVSGGNAGFFVGFSEDLPKEIGAAAVTPAKALGASAFRITLQWSPGQTALAASDAAKIDRAVGAAAGTRTVLAVYGTGDAAPTEATRREQYCGYVRAVLKRYPSIRDVVIWNEPNKSLFWRPQTNADGSAASPAAYEALLARCYDVLHGKLDNVNVIGLALSSTGNDDAGSRSPGDFIRRVGDAYRASGRSARILDTVAHHPYPSTASERPWRKHIAAKPIGEGDWNKLMYNLWLAFDGTAQQIPGSGGVTIWYSEGGFQTAVPAAKAAAYTGTENVTTIPDWTGGEPESPAPAETSAAPDQGTQALDAIRLAACQPYVASFFNFLLADEPILPGWQSGPLWADRTPKGSYAAFQQAISSATAGTVDCAALKGGQPSADFRPPTAPGATAATAANGPLRVDVSWSASIDDASSIAYRIYRNGTWAGTSSTTSWTNVAVAPTTTYTYTVRAIDAAGNLGDASPAATVTTPETSPPTAPAGLTAQPATSPTRVDLAWQPSTDNVGVTGYEVARDGVVLGTVAGTAYADDAVTAGATYAYAVVALDAAGNRSAAATASVTVPDAAPPNLIANGSFEADVSGWAGWQASATRVAGGAAGASAARVSFGGTGTEYAFTTSPRPVAPTAAGKTFRAAAQVRSDTPGRLLCLVFREWDSPSTVAGSGRSCVMGSGTWQPFPALAYTTAASGGSLELYVEQGGAVAGDSFDLDAVSLSAA